MTKHYLTKSNFKLGVECKQKLKYYKAKYPSSLQDNDMLEFFAEGGFMVEAIAHGDAKSSKVIGKAIEDIALPPGTTIGAIIRDEQVLIAHDDTVIEAGDHVILFLVDKKHIRDVEKLFHVGLSFF